MAASTPKRAARAREGAGAGPRLHDFSQPARFGAELRHRLAAALQTPVADLSERLAALFGSDVEVSPGAPAERTWAAARALLPPASLAVALRQADGAGALLLSIELPLVLGAIDALLGGDPVLAAEPRHLTEIDLALAAQLADELATTVSAAWSQLSATTLLRGELDLEGDSGIELHASEPTLLVALTVTVGGGAGEICLLVPWPAAEPVARLLEAHGARQPHAGDEALRRGLAAAPVLMRAEVGSIDLPFEELLALAPGATVLLRERCADGVQLYAEGVGVGRGRPGRSGTCRALKLEAIDEQPVRAPRYAALGRSALERARAAAPGSSSRTILGSVFVRVWAELGRTHMPLGHALELLPGAVVELDQEALAPVELFANGLRFASGTLVVGGEGEWGVQIEQMA